MAARAESLGAAVCGNRAACGGRCDDDLTGADRFTILIDKADAVTVMADRRNFGLLPDAQALLQEVREIAHCRLTASASRPATCQRASAACARCRFRRADKRPVPRGQKLRAMVEGKAAGTFC